MDNKVILFYNKQFLTEKFADIINFVWLFHEH